jgi:hypothetical protein
VSFVKNDRRRFEAKARRFALPQRPTVQMVRIVLLAALGAIAAAWAIAYHYTAKMPSMLRPAPPPPVPTYAEDAGEIPVPEIDTATP